MGRVTHRTSVLPRFMFEYEGTDLGLMALIAGFGSRHQGCFPAFDRGSRVRIMAIFAAYIPVIYWMRIRKVEGTPNVQVALKTGFRIIARIVDGPDFASGLIMNASRTMTRFASRIR